MITMLLGRHVLFYFLRILLLLGVVGISYYSACSAEWSYEVKDREGVRSIHVLRGPLWAPPTPPPYELLVREFRQLHPDRTPEIGIHRSLSDSEFPEWMMGIGIVNLVVGLAYKLVRRGRQDMLLDIAWSSGLLLMIFIIIDGVFLLGLIPFWIGLVIAGLAAFTVFRSYQARVHMNSVFGQQSNSQP